VPFIRGWTSQWKGYVPATVYVTVTVAPPPMALEHDPSSNVTVCGAPSAFVHVIDSPAFTVSPDGKPKSLIWAAIPFAPVVTSHDCPAADAATGEAGACVAGPAVAGPAVPGAGVAGVVVAPEAEHADSARAAAAAIAPSRTRRVIRGTPSGAVTSEEAGSAAPLASVRRRCARGFMGRLRRPSVGYLDGMTRTIRLDDATIRRLERHESDAHAIPAREVRDLGDALVLFDPRDPDPFWNRMVSVRWPYQPAAFDRRLADALALFGLLDRRPHIWPSPDHNRPADLVSRLQAHGFQDVGGGHLMLLEDVAACAPVDDHELGGRISIRRIVAAADATSDDIGDFARVLTEAFGALPMRAGELAVDLRQTLGDPRVALVLARVDGEPAAVAKATTFDGCTYLSSIGTRPGFRGRGLACLVTRQAVAAGAVHGRQLAYLGVFSGNLPALRLYERLGFASIGEAPDLLLG